jgi:hypothetical protein
MMSALKNFPPRMTRRRMREYLTNRCKARLFGALAPLVPNVEAIFDGLQILAEFKANGEEFLTNYRELAHLQPNEKMLDVGCGIGRKTLPLTQYLNEQAGEDPGVARDASVPDVTYEVLLGLCVGRRTTRHRRDGQRPGDVPASPSRAPLAP